MIHKDRLTKIQHKKKFLLFGDWQWHWGGFVLGFFFSFAGVVATLFFHDENKWDRFWTALHAAMWVGLLVVAIFALVATSNIY